MFTVRWERTAQNELANLWVQADSSQRKAVTAATHAIDQLLQVDPHDKGESRPNGRRILFHAPLAVIFRIIPQRTLVQVLHVWRFRQRGQ